MSIVTHHPSGVRVEIVGIQEGNRGRSCEQHNCCGRIIGLDTVLRLQKVQILNGKWKRRSCFSISILLVTVHIHQILIRCERWRNIDCCLLGYWRFGSMPRRLSSASLRLASLIFWWEIGSSRRNACRLRQPEAATILALQPWCLLCNTYWHWGVSST